MDDRMLALLLRLYPRPFRRRYAGEMEEVFRMQLQARRERGALALAALRLRTTLGMLGGAAAEWRQAAGAGGPGKSGKSSPGGVHPGGGGALFGFLESVATDVRLALRGLVRQRAFAVTAIGTLALGIGGVTTMWSVVHGVLLRPLPYADAERLVRLFRATDQWPVTDSIADESGAIAFATRTPDIRLATYRAILERSETLEDAVAIQSTLALLGTGDPDYTQRLRVGMVSWNFFPFLGAAPVLGRSFLPHENESDREAVVILSHELWRSAFGGDPDVLGRTVTLSDNPFTIVGVAPPAFQTLFRQSQVPAAAPLPGEEPGVWVPYEGSATTSGPGTSIVWRTARNNTFGASVNVVGRLRAGYSAAQAAEELRAIAVAEPSPPSLEYFAALEPLHDWVYGGPVRSRLILTLAAAALVLLLACANVANLLLGRTSTRQLELGTRSALGAGRRRLFRQLVTEAMVLSIFAAALGAGLAVAATRAIATLGPTDIARLSEARVDGAAFAVLALLALGCAVLFGLIPAWRGSTHLFRGQRHPPSGANHSLFRNPSRGMLIAGEMAMALVLLTSAVLLTRSFSRLLAVDLGFRPEGVLTARIQLPSDSYGDAAHTIGFAERLIERLESDPRISGAAVGRMVPVITLGNEMALANPAGAVTGERPVVNTVSSRYFEVLGMELVRGRAFISADQGDAPRVRILNETYASRAHPGEDALGQQFVNGYYNQARESGEIIGIVRDTPLQGYGPSWSVVYFPLNDERGSFGSFNVVVRALGRARDAEKLAPVLREVVRDLDPHVPVWDMQTMDSAVAHLLRVPRFYALLFSLFAALAAAIAAAGVFGVLAFMVSQRTHEIGVRLALGANPRDVVSLVVRQVAGLAAVGLLVGAAGAQATTRLLKSWLYEIEPADPASLAGAVALLLTVAVAAAWLPVRRAATVDPATTLRAE